MGDIYPYAVIFVSQGTSSSPKDDYIKIERKQTPNAAKARAKNLRKTGLIVIGAFGPEGNLE